MYYFERPAPRMLFLHVFRRNDPATSVVKPPVKYKGAFALKTRVAPPGTPERTVEVIFPRGGVAHPVVFADGPTDSPHRFGDGSLCMWYPDDPPGRRWVPSDGGEALLAHIASHLLREQWFRVTGAWAGDEVGHRQ